MVRLTVEKPDNVAETVTFDAATELTVGRSVECSCCLDFDPMVSRMHAVLLVDPPSVRIKDLNSTNGLIINGEMYGVVNNRRLIQPLELRDGDVVMIGRTRFTIGVFDTDLDLGPKLMEIKAEQAAADAASRQEERARREISGRKILARAKESFETVADAAAVCPDIPGYRTDRFLAAGKAGNVYKARANDGDRPVVLKVATPEPALTRKMAEDFRSEMESLKALSHKGVAELLAFGDAEHSTLYTVSEFVSGESLASYLGRCPGGKIPLSVAFSLWRQMTEGICFLHKNNVVHRDIHPAGIMLYDDGGKLRAKFTEAGLARFWAERGLGARGILASDVGRLGYLAPEELAQMQQGEAKPGADVFSLGCVFYRMVTGRVPYEFSDDVSAGRVVEEGRIRPIEELAHGLPETVVVVVERALAAEAEMRYESACEMLEAMENISL